MTKGIAQQISHIQEIVYQLNIRRSDDHFEITKQYGYLKFDEDALDSTTPLSQYIRLALHTDPRKVVEFLQQEWCLPKPELVISVTGGGKRCKMSVHLRKTFQRGLVAAAATTNAWLITGGRNFGVVKEVGKALNNYRYKNRKHGLDVPCIGICTWEYTASNEQLECPTIDSMLNNDTKVTFPWLRSRRRSRMNSLNPSNVTSDQYVRSYVVKQSDPKRYELEPNHSHFLIFDGKSSDLDTLLMQRAKIEEYSCQIDIKTSKKDERIPAVMILLEGGPFSVRTVCQALRSNTSLVVVKGSGRAADLVADLHTCFSQTENDQYDTQVKTYHAHYSSFPSRVVELYSIFEKARANNCPWVDEVKGKLCEVLPERKHLVMIFEFESPRHHGNLEDAILEALINVAKYSANNADENQGRVAELNLAMAWQKFDYTQKSILNDSTISQWREIDLRQALVDALSLGYADFVELFIDYGISLDKLTLGDIEQLYASADTERGLPVKKENEEDAPTRNDYYSTYFHHQFESDQMDMDKNTPLGANARRELFLWAIFVDRFDLAKYLCSKTWAISPFIKILILSNRRVA